MSDSSSSRSEIASRFGIRNLDADRRLAGDAFDQHRLGLHGEAQIVGQAGHLAVLHAGVRLELERRDDRPGMDLDDRALDGELAALLLEQPRRFHQLALVDLALGLRRIEQRRRRQRVAAQPALGGAAATARDRAAAAAEQRARAVASARPAGSTRRGGPTRVAASSSSSSSSHGTRLSPRACARCARCDAPARRRP